RAPGPTVPLLPAGSCGTLSKLSESIEQGTPVTHRVVARAAGPAPRGETAVPPDGSHHALPRTAPARLDHRLRDFLSRRLR
ncbi:hypothetical protein ACWGDT_46175, partial [Streptomyces avermitilis]